MHPKYWGRKNTGGMENATLAMHGHLVQILEKVDQKLMKTVLNGENVLYIRAMNCERICYCTVCTKIPYKCFHCHKEYT